MQPVCLPGCCHESASMTSARQFPVGNTTQLQPLLSASPASEKNVASKMASNQLLHHISNFTAFVEICRVHYTCQAQSNCCTNFLLHQIRTGPPPSSSDLSSLPHTPAQSRPTTVSVQIAMPECQSIFATRHLQGNWCPAPVLVLSLSAVFPGQFSALTLHQSLLKPCTMGVP